MGMSKPFEGLIRGLWAVLFLVIPVTGIASERVPWVSSRVQGSPRPAPPFVVEEIHSGSLERQVVDVQWVPGAARMLALHLNGLMRVIDGAANQNSTSVAIQLKERYPDLFQALGFTFDPNFETNRFLYLCYSRKPVPNSSSRIVRVSRFQLTDLQSLRFDSESEIELIHWEAQGHNGGCVLFGPDGYLYVSVGDGRPPSPPDALHTGQDVSDLRASILRIDVSRSRADRPYEVPKSNPFLDVPGARPEVWAYGFRNPWRMSFHPINGELWLGDVGWEKWEMIHRVEKGCNYGWSVYEGSQQLIHPNDDRGPSPIDPPIFEYPHTVGRSVTGGHFYFGEQYPELKGAYVFGDFESGIIYALERPTGESIRVKELARTGQQIISFSPGPDGELFVVGYDGALFRLVRNAVAKRGSPFPQTLTETGIFESLATLQPSPGVYPYEVVQELFEPGIHVERLIGLPGTAKIGTFRRNMLTKGLIKGEWHFPTNTVFARTVFLKGRSLTEPQGRRLETQVLHYDGRQFQPYNYIWNEEQTDAFLADEKATETEISGANHSQATPSTRKHFSRTDCLTCHLIRTGGVQGFVDWQLDRKVVLGGGTENQLQRFEKLGFFEDPVRVRQAGSDGHGDLNPATNTRARQYLHTNCSHCHRPQGGGGAQIDLRYETALADMKLVDRSALLGEFNLDRPSLVVPGEPTRSVIYFRMAKHGVGHMPRLGSSEIDYSGLRLIGDWIDQMLGASAVPSEDEGFSLDEFERADEGRRNDLIKLGLESNTKALGLLRRINVVGEALELEAMVVEQAMGHSSPMIQGLFEGRIPAGERVERLWDPIDPERVLSVAGDSNRGRRVFLGETGAQCVTCHKFEGQGRAIGPDLRGIGSRKSRRELLDSVLSPSELIDREYATYHIETQDGMQYSGMVAQQGLAHLSLILVDGRRIGIVRDEIISMEASTISLMPEGLLSGMPLKDAADLLSFLSEL